MDNKKFGSFESLGEIKKDFKNNEPFKEGSIRTTAMLVSPVSKKLLKFFSEEYTDIFDNYLKKHPESTVYIEKIKKALSSNDELSTDCYLVLDNLYIKFIKKVPASPEKNNGIVFGEWARRAGCDGQEAEEAKKLLGAFIETIWKNEDIWKN